MSLLSLGYRRLWLLSFFLSLELFSITPSNEASCHAVNCLMERPMGKGSKGGLQPTANDKQKPSVLQSSGNEFCQEPKQTWKAVLSQLSLQMRMQLSWHRDGLPLSPRVDNPAKLCLMPAPQKLWDNIERSSICSTAQKANRATQEASAFNPLTGKQPLFLEGKFVVCGKRETFFRRSVLSYHTVIYLKSWIRKAFIFLVDSGN